MLGELLPRAFALVIVADHSSARILGDVCAGSARNGAGSSGLEKIPVVDAPALGKIPSEKIDCLKTSASQLRRMNLIYLPLQQPTQTCGSHPNSLIWMSRGYRAPVVTLNPGSAIVSLSLSVTDRPLVLAIPWTEGLWMLPVLSNSAELAPIARMLAAKPIGIARIANMDAPAPPDDGRERLAAHRFNFDYPNGSGAEPPTSLPVPMATTAEACAGVPLRAMSHLAVAASQCNNDFRCYVRSSSPLLP